MSVVELLITLRPLFCVKRAYSWSFELGSVGMLLFVLPLSNMSRLKSPANIVWWLVCCVMRVKIWFWISSIRCVSCGCIGMYMFRRSIGISGLLLIIMAWRYGDIGLEVGNLVMFSFVYNDLGIMASMPPLACVGPEYMLCFCVILLELLYMSL